MNSRTPTPCRPQPPTRLRAVPSPEPLVPTSPVGLAVVDGSTSAADFSECVRIVLAVARHLQLDTPVFRSPPRIAGVDRSIQRRDKSTVVAIRRDDRPSAAVQADIIEGVVVANYLDPEEANEFRRLSWSAITSGLTPGMSPQRDTEPQLGHLDMLAAIAAPGEQHAA